MSGGSSSKPKWQMPPRRYRRAVGAETEARLEDIEHEFAHHRGGMQQQMVSSGLSGTTAQDAMYFEIEREREQAIREAEFSGMSAYYGLAQPYQRPPGVTSQQRTVGAVAGGASGALSGAMLGSQIGGKAGGWWGAGIGAVIGAGAGYFGAG